MPNKLVSNNVMLSMQGTSDPNTLARHQVLYSRELCLLPPCVQSLGVTPGEVRFNIMTR